VGGRLLADTDFADTRFRTKLKGRWVHMLWYATYLRGWKFQ